MKYITEYKLFESLSQECERLIRWWGLRGYLYYSSMKHKDPPITERGLQMLAVISNSVESNNYDVMKDYGRDNMKDPVWCEENVWKEMGKNYIDEIFSKNEKPITEPLKIYKHYDVGRFRPGVYGWYSFTTIDNPKDYTMFGDNYIRYLLPVGFKILDTAGNADKGEIIVNELHLSDSMMF